MNFKKITWQEKLKNYLKSAEYIDLIKRTNLEYKREKVCPRKKNLFKALQLTSFESVRVVILGQDPYYTPNVADGLCFSSSNFQIQPSLKNIFKEIENDIGKKSNALNGNLEIWAQQGVLLLNSILIAKEGEPGFYKDFGWQKFTDFIIKTLSDQKTGIVFMLWGNFAKSKKGLIDKSKHLILESSHPSPLSAHNGFLGNKHFSKANLFLRKNRLKEISW